MKIRVVSSGKGNFTLNFSERVVTLLSGDYELFRSHARRYGFNERILSA